MTSNRQVLKPLAKFAIDALEQHSKPLAGIAIDVPRATVAGGWY